MFHVFVLKLVFHADADVLSGSDEDATPVQVAVRNVEPVIGPVPDVVETATNKPLK